MQFFVAVSRDRHAGGEFRLTRMRARLKPLLAITATHTLGILVVFGGLTILLQDRTFIMWKPSVINWLFGIVFLASQFIGDKPLLVVAYHGHSDQFSKQMNVLIDGRSIYDPLLGGVNWYNIPIVLDDIERIEVTRGPNASTYGSNSFQAVINIITRRDDSGFRARAETGGGRYGTRKAAGEFALAGDTAAGGINASWLDTDGFPTLKASTDDAGYDNLTFDGYLATTRTPGLTGDDYAWSTRMIYDAAEWSYRLAWTEVREDFNPEVGFLQRLGLDRVGLFGGVCVVGLVAAGLHRILEVSDPLAEALAEPGELVDAENQDHDREYDEQLGQTECTEHVDLRSGRCAPTDSV